jgi:Ca2+-binding RTX toxin-like protein
LTLNASSLTTGRLTFNGAEESDGAFNITGGGDDDSITGGAQNDFLAGGAGKDTLAGEDGNDTFTFVATTGLTKDDTVNGGAGTDTVALTGNTAIAASDFDNVKNIETITLGNTDTTVSITTKDALVEGGATLTLSNAGNSGALIFDGDNENDSSFNITGGTGIDSITGGDKNDILAGGAGNDTLVGGKGNDTLTGNAGADTITLGGNANDNVRQTVIYSSASDGAAAGANSGADTITQFDANLNDSTDDLIQITETLRDAVDDDVDGVLDYVATNIADQGNQLIVGGAGQEATVLVDVEVEIGVGAFTQLNLTDLLVELGEEIDFSGIATGEEHVFLINFSDTQAAVVLYTAGTGGDDAIVLTDIQVLGIVTHNDGTNLDAGNMTF